MRSLLLRVGDVVEVQAFSGALQLARVCADTELSGDSRIGVKYADGRRAEVSGMALRWHMPQGSLTSQMDLSGLYARAKEEVIKAHSVFAQLVLKRASDPLSRLNLVYERNVANGVFGAQPTAPQLYATHLWLYSYSKRVGRDSAFTLANAEGAGPYYARPDFQVADKCIESRTLDSADGRRLLQRAASVDWNDATGNPFLAATVALTRDGPVIETRDDALTALASVDPAAFDLVDVARLRSGLDFSSADEYESANLPAIDVKGDSHKRTTYDEEAFAIDAAYTIEVDDAISLGRDRAGRTLLRVHIADPVCVAPYGSPSFARALERVSSSYFADRTFRMLPDNVRAISSLAPNSINRCVTFTARLTDQGDIADANVELTQVSNVTRMTPSNVNARLSDPAGTLSAIKDIANLHKSWRIARGAYAFNAPKARAHLDKDTGKLSLVREQATPATELVAECMIIAGRVAAAWAQSEGVPAPYRVHESLSGFAPPAPDASVTEILNALTSLRPSHLVSRPGRHDAMALEMYTRATSPLRRAADLVLHQQIHGRLASAHVLGQRQLDGIVPAMDTHEQYLKRLAAASNRYWTLRYIAQEHSAASRPLETDVIVVKRTHRGATVFLVEYALFVYNAAVPYSVPDNATVRASITFVDAVRQVVDIRFDH